MNLALWIAAGLLAAVALLSGSFKTFVPKEKLAKAPGAGWVEHVGAGTVKTIGVLELSAAVGLILPALLDIVPVLVPVTAVGWALLMAGAIVTHVRLREYPSIGANAVYLALAAFIAWGRFVIEPFTG
ncbi:DoxX family protein [Nocardia fluminea]|uniref:DoxX family protein n=1 Tax=Nocardia fluminea TaxID=134984 RepID=UPI003651DE91